MADPSTPSHDEALLALSKIRKATYAADLARMVAFKAKLAYKEAKNTAEAFDASAREVARAQTYPLPLFDEADGISHVEPGPEPAASAGKPTPKRSQKDRDKDALNAQFRPSLGDDQAELSELALPEEVLASLGAMGFKTVGTLKAFRDAGCHWQIIPGIDEAGAHRIEQTLNARAWQALGITPPTAESDDNAGKDAA